MISASPFLASVNNSGGGGVLTLIFPLVLVFVVAAIWASWWIRRSRNNS